MPDIQKKECTNWKVGEKCPFKKNLPSSKIITCSNEEECPYKGGVIGKIDFFDLGLEEKPITQPEQ